MDLLITPSVISVNVGPVREFKWRGGVETSAIWKHPVEGRLLVRGVNIEGDDQADRHFHGGPRKAVYAYAIEDYAWWERELGKPLEPGTFGENLTLGGIEIADHLVGEKWKVGSCVLQLTQPRVPCWKLGVRMEDPKFPRRFSLAERCGTYLTIIEEGDVGAGDPIEIVEVPEHPVSIGMLAHFNYVDRPTAEMLLNAATHLKLKKGDWEKLLTGQQVDLESDSDEPMAGAVLGDSGEAFADEPLERP